MGKCVCRRDVRTRFLLPRWRLDCHFEMAGTGALERVGACHSRSRTRRDSSASVTTSFRKPSSSQPLDFSKGMPATQYVLSCGLPFIVLLLAVRSCIFSLSSFQFLSFAGVLAVFPPEQYFRVEGTASETMLGGC